MATETDLDVDGRTLHVYDSGPADAALTVFWHHGTPGTGDVPENLLPASARRGIRWVSHDRPGYAGSTARRDRSVASVAADVAAIADALGVDRFAAFGHSGGGPHSLACAALLPDRVVAAVSVSGPAPYGAEGLDWFDGMYPSGEAELRAALTGPGALATLLETSGYDPEMFTPDDHAALAGELRWLGASAGRGMESGLDPMVDDDLTLVRPWGFTPGQVTPPVLLLHGGRDRVIPVAHGEWLGAHLPSAELRILPEDGHVSVLTHAEVALDWLDERASG